jgi:hypothetical protein
MDRSSLGVEGSIPYGMRLCLVLLPLSLRRVARFRVACCSYDDVRCRLVAIN